VVGSRKVYALPGEPTVEHARAVPNARTRGDRLSVLLVDDDVDALAAFALYLRTTGLEVVTAAGGRLALQLMDSYIPDVVVVDMTMPCFSGLDFIAALKSRRETAGIPTVLLSGRPFHVADRRIDACLAKPCLPSELLAVVRGLGGRG
jgi:two-component system, OmpR family, response regulator ChvI